MPIKKYMLNVDGKDHQVQSAKQNVTIAQNKSFKIAFFN